MATHCGWNTTTRTNRLIHDEWVAYQVQHSTTGKMSAMQRISSCSYASTFIYSLHIQHNSQTRSAALSQKLPGNITNEKQLQQCKPQISDETDHIKINSWQHYTCNTQVSGVTLWLHENYHTTTCNDLFCDVRKVKKNARFASSPQI